MENCSSGNSLADLLAKKLHFSEFHVSNNAPNHDCTLRVGTPSTSYRDFKCHKSILSNASDFFERTFFGNFKEAKMGPDEPILLNNIEPLVFECALRHIYGHVNDLRNKSVLFKTKLYRMADEMLITSLVRELDSSFYGTTAPDVFSLFDLFVFLGNQLGINICKQILATATTEDYRSEHWLKMSHESVLEFMKMEYLYIEEVDLVRALVAWGKYHVLKEGGDPLDSRQLRQKILPSLKLIRIFAMNLEDFLLLCQVEEVGAMMGQNEKSAILEAITNGNVKQSSAYSKRKKPPIEFNLPCMQYFNPIARQGLFTANLIFQLNQKAEFLGLRVGAPTAAYGPFTIQVYNAHNYEIIATVWSEENKIVYCGEEYCPITPKCILSAGTKYNLSFTFPRADAFLHAKHPNYPYFTLPLNRFTCNGLTLSIDSTVIHVFVKSLLFAKLT